MRAGRRFDPEVRRKPRKLPPGFFSWIPSILRYSEQNVIDVCGLDTAVFLRLINFGGAPHLLQRSSLLQHSHVVVKLRRRFLNATRCQILHLRDSMVYGSCITGQLHGNVQCICNVTLSCIAIH